MIKRGISERRGCVLCQISRSTFRYQGHQNEDELVKKILKYIQKHPRFGYRRVHALLLREGEMVNHKRVARIWKENELSIPKRRKRKKTAKKDQSWLKAQGIQTYYIDPGSPWQNGHNESFNGKLRVECLNMEVFSNMTEARVILENWRHYYNEERPHSSLSYQTPTEFKEANS